ncbi:CvfB family protein [Myroides indicus]|uniref:S1 motif domain-containing protein n=1 Tax=Myroides indicus TaxID=1323422 RepID=A0A4R7EPB9_9FLAO|nr:S1-like domain-containing RNA-binding protein [Myroides indicus]TDS53841.1 hypothetical protein C8P70_12738 [Myroides indicus]
MIKIGDDNKLKIDRKTSVGLFLTDGEKDILLPNKYVPKKYEIGDEIIVFVYLDQEERPVATTIEPYIYINEFALLKVSYINQYGAFMNIGLEKDLFVPFAEQARPMKEGNHYLVYMYLDEKTNRLVGSSKLNQFLDNNELTVSEGEEVELVVSHITELGINVIINEKHRGLMYKNEVFEDLRTGDRIIGYIKTIRPDGKIDVTRNKIGFDGILDSASLILEELRNNNGFLGLTDNSHPEDIKTVLNMSKKAFKKAIGTLYKQKKIDIQENGIFLIE